MSSVTFKQMPWRAAGPRSIPQAFPYQGSKRLLASQILSLFPEGGVSRLVEPFAGSAAISLAARNYGLAGAVALSDVNKPLMELWKLIVDQPLQLIESYTRLWTEQIGDPRGYYMATRNDFNATHDPTLLLYLLCRCVKAAVRYSQKTGEFNQGADHRRLGAKPANIAARIKAASKLMQGAKVSACTYEDPLVSADVDELVYLDPPYQGTSDVPDHRYLEGLRREAFADTLQKAIDNRVSFIVSYDAVTDDYRYGQALPKELGLVHRHVVAGLSSQATLMGKSQTTTESLYVSPALVKRLGGAESIDARLDMNPMPSNALF
ncbi:DNA adenine methylase [Amycolatopsis thailandensis]|uniref:DNA adenine methylase n=1 Tax=Amycolatopsis thailandensis TaxID=589330 RepID=UPI00362A4B03